MRVKTPAVAYVRMSSDKQEASPQQQRDEIEKLADGKYTIVRWYEDHGISGAESTKREGFQRLITDANDKGDFSAILCWDQDRFSRFDPIEANYYWHILSQAGVKIVTATQGELDFADLGGWLTASVTQYGKAQYLRDLSKNVLRARVRNAEAGRYTGNRAPYGYRLDDGKLLLGDPERVEIVQWLFRQYIETDTSLQDLAEQLNQRGALPPAGKGKWQRAAIQVILRRDAYTGKASQLREAKGKFNTIKGGRIAASRGYEKKPEEDWYFVDCPQIVDVATFNKAAKKMTERKRQTSSRAPGRRGLLAGLLVCKHCGRHMVAGWGGKEAAKTEKFYQCGTYVARGKHACYRNLLRESRVVDFLVPKIQDTLANPLNFDRLTKAIRRVAADRSTTAPDDSIRLAAKVAKLDEEIKAAAKELKRTPDDLYDLAVADLRELRAQRDEVADALQAAEARRDAPRDHTDTIVERALAGLDDLRERLSSADDRVARGAMQSLISGIEVEFDHEHRANSVRSHFRRGTVVFNNCKLVASEQSASFTSTKNLASSGDARSISMSCPRWPPR